MPSLLCPWRCCCPFSCCSGTGAAIVRRAGSFCPACCPQPLCRWAPGFHFDLPRLAPPGFPRQHHSDWRRISAAGRRRRSSLPARHRCCHVLPLYPRQPRASPRRGRAGCRARNSAAPGARIVSPTLARIHSGGCLPARAGSRRRLSTRCLRSLTAPRLIVVGDVSGKGLKAAMTGALAIGALRALADGQSFSRRLACRGSTTRCLQRRTAALLPASASASTPSGAVTMANAGHLSPYRRGEEVAARLRPSARNRCRDRVRGDCSFIFEPGDTLTLSYRRRGRGPQQFRWPTLRLRCAPAQFQHAIRPRVSLSRAGLWAGRRHHRADRGTGGALA